MGTRANIIIKDSSDQLFFYRHSDGYPDVTLESLKKFCDGYSKHLRDNVEQSAGWLIIHGREEYMKDDLLSSPSYAFKVGAYEPAACLHGDVEFVYIIDLVKGTIETKECTSGFWDKPSLKNTKKLSVTKFAVRGDE